MIRQTHTGVTEVTLCVEVFMNSFSERRLRFTTNDASENTPEHSLYVLIGEDCTVEAGAAGVWIADRGGKKEFMICSVLPTVFQSSEHMLSNSVIDCVGGVGIVKVAKSVDDMIHASMRALQDRCSDSEWL